MYYDTFAKLCEMKGVKPGRVAKETGIATSTITAWKQGKYTPKPDKLQKLADYFEVSIEYFMNGENPKGYYLNNETAKVAQEIFENKELRALFSVQRDMSPDDLRALHGMALALKRKEGYGGDDPA